MRASRLLSVLLLLQGRGRMTARELASELDVSVRTVYRDVESLSAAGVPVYADRGPAGGYQLLDGYRTRLTGLTGDEAESLFVAGIPEPAAAELGLGSVLAAAQLKIMAALPPELRTRAGRIRERVHLDAPGWFREVERPRHLTGVADAVWNQRVIEIRYVRAGSARREVTRTLEPHGLVLKTGVWYLAARPHTAPLEEGTSHPNAPAQGAPDPNPPAQGAPDPNPSAQGTPHANLLAQGTPHATGQPDPPARAAAGMRTYRISRIVALTTRDEHFARVDDFDLATYWQDWSDQYRERLYRGEAVVRFSERGLFLLGYYLGPVAARAARANAGPPDAEGWVRTVIPIESLTHARHELLQFGVDAEVLEPAELRTLLAETAQAVALLYA
ncbi:WYL domain-containing protein [Actinopolymorpha sp. B17G11]|uniref:helix-turn-helix transcriptional regulator n=1 Tax=Actinopolymorpha sp. B17G11 TaxID=3160861 RepID=UPI0032E432A8